MKQALLLLSLVSVMVMVPIFGASPEVHHGNNPSPYVHLLGAASPLTSDEWSLIYSIDVGLAETLSVIFTPLSNCGDEAIRICGKGNVCWVCVTGNHNQSCSYACRASDGSCQPTPPCDSDVAY